MYKPVPVVIPYFRAPEALQKTLDCLESQRHVKALPFIRDNSEDNILFTKAVNQGLRQFVDNQDYDYILVLNQDAFLHQECLEQMVLAMQANMSAGICGPISLSANKSVNWAGSGAAFPWGQHLSYDLTSLPKAPFQTYWVNGACMLLRREMIREIGLLDEAMRFICSDADYSFTARSRGWSCIVAPSAFIEHELSGSAGSSNLPLTKIKLEDQLFFSRKWLGSGLYQSLAYEASQLTPEFVSAQLEKTRRELDACNQMLQDKTS